MLKKINNVTVTAVPLPNETRLPVKGEKLFQNAYANIFICARKRSGKTCLIFKILKSCVGRDTRVVFIVPTVNKDSTYDVMIDWLSDRGNEVETYESLKEGKQSVIESVLEQTGGGAEAEVKQKPPPCTFINFGVPDEEEELPVTKKEKTLAPEIIFVLDDLGSELRHKSVANLLKKNRHYRSKVIISSQYVNDLEPSAIKQLDYWIGFKGHSQDKMKLIHKHLDLATPFDRFYEMYKIATKDPYTFLYVDTVKELFRKNFNYALTP